MLGFKNKDKTSEELWVFVITIEKNKAKFSIEDLQPNVNTLQPINKKIFAIIITVSHIYQYSIYISSVHVD